MRPSSRTGMAGLPGWVTFDGMEMLQVPRLATGDELAATCEMLRH